MDDAGYWLIGYCSRFEISMKCPLTHAWVRVAYAAEWLKSAAYPFRFCHQCGVKQERFFFMWFTVDRFPWEA